MSWKITGQKAVSTISKKDVASFKLRKGMPIGAKVTAWRKNVWVSYYSALPRVRDFIWIRWLRGNYKPWCFNHHFFQKLILTKLTKYPIYYLRNTQRQKQVVINRIRFTFLRKKTWLKNQWKPVRLREKNGCKVCWEKKSFVRLEIS
jgi:hypothetical protein